MIERCWLNERIQLPKASTVVPLLCGTYAFYIFILRESLLKSRDLILKQFCKEKSTYQEKAKKIEDRRSWSVHVFNLKPIRVAKRKKKGRSPQKKQGKLTTSRTESLHFIPHTLA